ncbi:MAG: HAMP domain-containing protein [Bdellovibrio sp.]|nr:MAG: HAMP domain-containing protein [Bdellovibrio sp.]
MKNKILFPIWLKLTLITVLVLVAVAASIAFTSSDLFEHQALNREQTFNQTEAQARAMEVESLFLNIVDKVTVVGGLLLKERFEGANIQKSLDLTFRRDRDIVAVEVVSSQGQVLKRIVNEAFLKQYGFSKDYIAQLRERLKAAKRFSQAAVFAGEIEIRNSSFKDGVPLITIGIPLHRNENDQVDYIAIADIRMDRVQRGFSTSGERTMYLVDRDGRLLAHPNENWVFEARSMKNIDVVKEAFKSSARVGQKPLYKDPTTGQEFTGAYAKIPSFHLAVISQANKDVILEGARRVRYDAFRTTGRAVSVVFFVIFLFSISLTAPIEKLVDAAKEIAKGNFEVRSQVRSHDEVGTLASAFDQMVDGLKERDKMKNVLNKFHGSSIAEDILKGDLELGGSRKKVTVFFSDIRDFTKFSEGHTAEEVVDMLNEYFQIMVGIINKHHGVVDKFIGDAIMAVWGAPEPSEEDEYNAVKACLEMRQALEELNQKRLQRGQVEIKIGIGLHTGEAISGTIGSSERMEYTVIGDAVNQAARIEASTKAFGADLLLSDEIAEKVKDRFILELAGKAEVKGKSKPLTLYKVRGYVSETGEKIWVRTKYSDYEAAAADKVKVAS